MNFRHNVGFLPLLLCWNLSQSMTNIIVNIVVFAPKNNSFGYSIARITPAMEIARERTVLPPFVELNLTFCDSKFPDETSVELDAINFIMNEFAHLFIGPIYDFPLSHLARISAADYNMPVISPGGLSLSFGANKSEHTIYKTLVRIGPTMNKLSDIISWIIFHFFKYKHMKVLTEKHDSALQTCKIFYSAFDDLLNQIKNRRDPNIQFDLHQFPKKYDPEGILRREVGVNYSGIFYVGFSSRWPIGTHNKNIVAFYRLMLPGL